MADTLPWTAGRGHDGGVTLPPKDLATALLDAQVAWALDQLTTDRLGTLIEREVDELLAIAARYRVDELLDVESVKLTAQVVMDIIATSDVVADLAVEDTVAVHGLVNAGEHLLADVVEREDVDTLVAVFLAMSQLHERGLGRIAESPLVGVVASRFVTKLVSDVVQQNRELAEKLPGMSSLFSIGSSAAKRVRNVTDKHVETLLGDATDKSAQYAIRRTNAAILDLVRDAPLHGAAMETWELQAAEPMSELYAYVRTNEVRELAIVVHRMVAQAAASEHAVAALDACVDVFFERYGALDVGALLEETGVTRDDLVDAAARHLPAVLDTLRASGELESIVRARLEPFFASPAVTALLGGTPAPRARPAKRAK